jgi:hypothetical protein
MIQNIAIIVTLLVSVLALLGGIITVWVNTNVKIAKIETTVNLKIASIELAISNYIKSNSESIKCSFSDNKEEHKDLMKDVKEIRASVNEIGIQVAKLAK